MDSKAGYNEAYFQEIYNKQNGSGPYSCHDRGHGLDNG